jgi:hypothetical protein
VRCIRSFVFPLFPLHAGAASLCSAPANDPAIQFRKKKPAMRAETENLVDEIKQGITLLRRHL